MRRQQAQEESEARELSVLYGTSCETILALKRSLQPNDETSQADDEHLDDQDEEDDENGAGFIEHESTKNDRKISSGNYSIFAFK